MKTRQEIIDFCLTFPAAYEDYPFADIKDILDDELKRMIEQSYNLIKPKGKRAKNQ